MDEYNQVMGERMAVIETKVDDLKKDVSDVRSDIKEIKNMLNNYDDKYARKTDLKNTIEAFEKQLDNQRRWIYGISMALITALIGYGIKILFHL